MIQKISCLSELFQLNNSVDTVQEKEQVSIMELALPLGKQIDRGLIETAMNRIDLSTSNKKSVPKHAFW